MKYEETVRKICGENWRDASTTDREGGYGVAIVYAFLKGTRPTINDMSNSLDVDISDIEIPYSRLARAGVFSKKWNAKSDPYLNIKNIDSWGFSHIAGLASGNIGNW